MLNGKKVLLYSFIVASSVTLILFLFSYLQLSVYLSGIIVLIASLQAVIYTIFYNRLARKLHQTLRPPQEYLAGIACCFLSLFWFVGGSALQIGLDSITYGVPLSNDVLLTLKLMLAAICWFSLFGASLIGLTLWHYAQTSYQKLKMQL